MLTKQDSERRPSHNNLAWAREVMESEGVSQRDVARAWEISESGVSRWLDGLTTSELSFRRVVIFSRLVRRSLDEIATRMGLEIWTADEKPAQLQSLPSDRVPLPTFEVSRAKDEGWYLLLLHQRLSATSLMAVLASLEKEKEQKPSTPDDEVLAG